MLKIDSIFFDVDGTLVDSTADIANAINYALGELKLAQLPKDVIASYIGTGTSDLARKCLGEGNQNHLDSAVKLFSDYYSKHAFDQARLYPHVVETLEHFRNKKKYIITNRFKKFAKATLRGAEILKYFEDIFGGDDESCLKPMACALDPVISRLGIDKAKSLIVGDMAIDIMTGNNARIKTCWVSYGLGKREDVIPLKPNYIIDDMERLETIIQ